MISSLDDAWLWYESVKSFTHDLKRFGEKYWDRDEFAEALGKDNHFRFVDSSSISVRAAVIENDLDDLGVLLLFSVFEATVRDRAREDVQESLPERLHTAVVFAIKELMRDIESGSFGRVTAAFKGMDVDLVEEVNQVRRYRNWVAHGRRGVPPNSVVPRLAYDRLRRFLEKMPGAAS